MAFGSWSRMSGVVKSCSHPFGGRFPVVGAGGVEQQQSVPGRGGVDDDEFAARFVNHPRKRLKDRHFLGAG